MFTNISAGYSHYLAIQHDGTVVAWGDNDYGESSPPAGLSNVVGVAAGNSISLARLANGKVAAWGTFLLWTHQCSGFSHEH